MISRRVKQKVDDLLSQEAICNDDKRIKNELLLLSYGKPQISRYIDECRKKRSQPKAPTPSFVRAFQERE